MKRTTVRIEDVADYGNLCWASWRAALGRRNGRVTDGRTVPCGAWARELLHGTWRPDAMRRFLIRDPKPRVIHAPSFRDRVVHHALMRWVGPPIDRSLVDSTFACRTGKGSLAAVHAAQRHQRSCAWFAKVDMRRYFDSVPHDRLIDAVARRIRGRAVLELLERIVRSYRASPGRGLPIGALTSQHLANLYLAPLDRYLLEQHRVPHVRYMDDVVWWCRTRIEARSTLAAVREFVATELGLQLKPGVEVLPTKAYLDFCGFRIGRNRLLLSRRRKQRYRLGRRRWEGLWRDGVIDAATLQRGAASAVAITSHADAVGWRRKQLLLQPAVEA